MLVCILFAVVLQVYVQRQSPMHINNNMQNISSALLSLMYSFCTLILELCSMNIVGSYDKLLVIFLICKLL